MAILMLILELIILFAMIQYLLKKGLTPFSPVMIVVYIYLLSYLGGYLFFDAEFADVPKFFTKNTPTSYQTILELIALLLAVMSGAYISTQFRNKKYSMRVLSLPKINLKKQYILYPIISMIIYILGNGLSGVLYRQEYLIFDFLPLKIAGAAMMIPASAILGFYYFSSKSLFKYLALFIFVLIELLYLSLSTRMFAFAPILFALGGILTPKRKFAGWVIIMFLMLGPYLVMIPIKLRGDEEQGLIPLLFKIVNGELLTNDFGLLDSLNNLFFFSFPLTDYTINVAPVDLDYILLNLNPLPGFMTTWSSVDSRVNNAIPYSGIGEVIKYSFPLALLIYFILGFYISKLEIYCRKRQNILLMISTYMFFTFFSILSTQYAFRSAMRTIYYLVIIHILMLLFSMFIRKPKKAFPYLKPNVVGRQTRQEKFL